jgi:DNA mismatch repair protein MutS2
MPLTIELGKDFTTLVITGPNAGGKTVALKTVGLLALMAQAGIPIPASEESSLPVFDRIFADIGDQQSIEHTLSTFSWHINNINNIIRDSTAGSLVLLDELGISTDPEEGSALARAILLKFLDKGTLVVSTTHYNDLKIFAHVTSGMKNASMDFDQTTLMPTYHLSVGIPGKSNALSVAEQLGTPVEIIEKARGMLGKTTADVEILLSDLRKEKQKYESLQRQLEEDRSRIKLVQNELDAESSRLKDKEYRVLAEVNERLTRETTLLQRLIKDTELELKKARKREDVEHVKKATLEIRKAIDAETDKAKAALGNTMPPTGGGVENVSEGDIVRLRDKSIQGTVLSVDAGNRRVEVQAGNSRITVDMNEIEKIVQSLHDIPSYSMVKKRRNTFLGVSYELDLRGKRADEVEGLLDRFLNDAFLTNLKEVRIIHGYATGTIRQIVRDILLKHPLVKSSLPGGKGEGGDGVTIANLQ